MLFSFGQVLMTIGIAELSKSDVSFESGITDSLTRHINGDWGDLCDEDKKVNDEALTSRDRILSVYHIGETKIYIITEADRSATTVLLPEEY
jgi:hypothetical protein